MENKVDTELTGLIDVFVLSMEIYKLDWMELENGDGNLVGKQRKGDLFFFSFDLAGTHYGTFAPALGFGLRHSAATVDVDLMWMSGRGLGVHLILLQFRQTCITLICELK
jgi:hypothetical protein